MWIRTARGQLLNTSKVSFFQIEPNDGSGNMPWLVMAYLDVGSLIVEEFPSEQKAMQRRDQFEGMLNEPSTVVFIEEKN